MPLNTIRLRLASLFSKKKKTDQVPAFFVKENRTVLIIDEYIPYHDKSSGSKRLYELILLFKELDLNIIFLPDDGLPTEPYYSELQKLNIEVLLHSPDEANMLKSSKALLRRIDYAWISRPLMNKKYQKLIRKNKCIKIIFDTVDLHYIRMLRQAEKSDDKRLKKNALKIKELEIGLAAASDATITVTEAEKNILQEKGLKNIYVIPNIHKLQIPSEPLSFNKRKGVLFIGGYKHEPNIDAVKWLVNDIMPLVWEKAGPIPVYLLGSDPNDEVLQLAGPLITVPGYLPDVMAYFLSSRIFVAPLTYGAGMKGKIGQSLEYGLPIVSTSIGTEGMGLTDGVDVLTADDAAGFAEKIIRLYQDENLWIRIRDNAVNSIDEYSPNKVSKKLRALFNTLGNG